MESSDPSTNTNGGGGGGRLWKLAGEMAALNAQSRAQPHVVVETTEPPSRLIVIRPEEAAPFVVSRKGKSKKNDCHHYQQNQTPLLLLALSCTLCGILGNFLISSSCYFVSQPLYTTSTTIHLHFGLWNYSPLDSSMNGYKSCIGYEHTKYADMAPTLPRSMNLLALVFSIFPMIVVWGYIIIVGGSQFKLERYWSIAVYCGALTAICQLVGVVSVFFGTLCRSSSSSNAGGGCGMGAAACIGVLYSAVWAGLTYQLHHYRPKAENGLKSTELSDLSSARQSSLDLSKRSKLYTPPKNVI